MDETAMRTAELPRAVVGWFEKPDALVACAKRLRSAGYAKIDAHTPFPIHGLDKALGIRPSPIAKLVLVAGATGLSAAFLLAWYTQAVSYPLRISGKVPFSVEAYIPVMFEVTVLASALCAFFGLWALCGLPRLHHATFGHPSFHRATDDAFFISVEDDKPSSERAALCRLLEESGAREVMEVS